MSSRKLSLVSAFLFGFLIWLLPFLFSFAIFGFHATNRQLFESLMAAFLALVVTVLAYLHFRRARGQYWRDGVALGVIWYALAVAIDLAMFMWGPMKTTFAAYMADIGLTYLIIPTVTVGMGALAAVISRRR